VRKSFGETLVLDDVDVTVGAGTIFALLGPNGAGKTTMVRILTTLIAADAGSVRVAGHDVRDDADGVRAAIGATGQFSALDDLLSGEENLQLMADLNRLGRTAGRRRVAELLERFDLVDAADRHVVTWSGGMRRREEADRLADHVVLLDRGRVAAEGTPDALKSRVGGERVVLRFAEPPALDRALAVLATHDARPGGAPLTASLPSDGSADHVRRVLDDLHRHGVPVDSVATVRPTLDDVFLALTGSRPAAATADPVTA
jgi:ABC-2 type transport system ATP-binding protein